MVEISLSGSGEGLGRAIARGYIARLLGISLGRLRNKLTAGNPLPPRIEPPGCRNRLWPRAAVHEWLQQFTVTAAPAFAARPAHETGSAYSAPMSIAAMNWAWAQALPPTPKLVLMALADAADDHGVCWPSATTLARNCSVSTRTVRRILQELVQRGLIDTEARFRKDGSRTANRYVMALRVGQGRQR